MITLAQLDRDKALSPAPELLDALQAMVDRWEPDCIGTDRVMWENAVAAIARAEGRS